MAQLPKSKLKLATTGGPVGSGTDTLIVGFPAYSGPLFSPQLFTSVAALLATFGACAGVDFMAHYIDDTGLPVVAVAMTPIAPSLVLAPIDVTGVTGNAVPSVAGTPVDDADIRILISSGGALGTAGIVFQYSLDGGETYSRGIRLGASLTYVIPNTGITVTFGSSAATLVANDVIAVRVFGPTFDATDLASLETALAGSQMLGRLVHLIGDQSASVAQSVSDTMDDYESAKNRDCRAVGALRGILPKARKATGGTVSFAVTANTITRSAGSWLTDGFAVGMTVTVSGSASNNVVNAPIIALTSTVLTTSAVLATEATVSNVTVIGTESETAWMAALDTITVGKIWPRLSLFGGHAMRTSPIDLSRKKRSAAWALVCRYMAHDVQVSPAEVALGRLNGWTIYNSQNQLVCHDERVNGGLLNSRVSCLTSFDGDLGGTYVALALVLTEDDGVLSRLPCACVADLTCTLVRGYLTKRLNTRVALDKKTGFMLEGEARKIESTINTQLRGQLITPRPEGQRASDVNFTIVRGTDLRSPGAKVGWLCTLELLGYIEQLDGTVVAQGASS